MLDNFDFSAITSAADLYKKLNICMGVETEDNYFDRRSNLTPEQYK
jgi:hypothetical protein